MSDLYFTAKKRNFVQTSPAFFSMKKSFQSEISALKDMISSSEIELDSFFLAHQAVFNYIYLK